MQTEDDLAELFERAVADLTPNVGFIVQRAEQLGRRRRHRTRLCRAAGSTLALALMAGAGYGAWAVSQIDGSRWHGQATGAAGSATTGRHAQSATAGNPKHKPASPRHKKQPATQGWAKQPPAPSKPMKEREMLRIFRSMLPAGAVLSSVPSAAHEPGSLEVNYNDGQGMVDVMLSIGTFDQTALTCPNPLWTDEGTRPAGALPISCLVRTPPGGGVERAAVMYADSYGFYGYNIYDRRPDGVEVFIQVANGYFDPYLPHVDRATPPGSMSLWESVVESPAWHA
jgi:hypothetical protein